MAIFSKKPVISPSTPTDDSSPKEKTLPPRPGTSGTELNLRVNRQKASTAYQRAQRAEQAYRAKRQATMARADVQAAKEHFKMVGKGLKGGVSCGWRVFRALPGVWKEREERIKKEAEQKKKEKAEAKKKAREEKETKRRELEAEAEGEAATGEVVEATPA